MSEKSSNNLAPGAQVEWTVNGATLRGRIVEAIPPGNRKSEESHGSAKWHGEDGWTYLIETDDGATLKKLPDEISPIED